MAQESSIQWTEQTWNPVTGCHKISPGCKNCYAADIAHRFWGERPFTDVRCHEDRLDQPLKRKKPTTYFVNSMSDLFDEAVPDGFIDQVFAVMALAKRHTFQVLTKRAGRMYDYCRTLGRHHEQDRVSLAAKAITKDHGFMWIAGQGGWHLPNCWLGVSVEDQQRADERIPHLLQTPAAVRFLSCEPLLGSLDLEQYLGWPCDYCVGIERFGLTNSDCPYCAGTGHARGYRNGQMLPGTIGWIIAGGESGPQARPCDLAWLRSTVQQCREAQVPVFVKQLGSRPYLGCDGTGQPKGFLQLKDSKGGDIDEFPEDLRVREFPTVEK